MTFLALFSSCVFSVLLALRLPRFGKRELILVLFVRLFDLRLFGFVPAVCDCDTPWPFLLPFFFLETKSTQNHQNRRLGLIESSYATLYFATA